MTVRFRRVLLAITLLASLTSPATTLATSTPGATAPGPVYLKAAGLAGAPASGDSIAPQADSVSDAIPLPASPASGRLAAQGRSTLYAVDLTAGSRIELSLASVDAAFDVFLFAPGLGSLSNATAVAHASAGDGYPTTLAYDVPADLNGTYYIEVYAYEGSGTYTLSWLARDASERARVDVPAASAITLPHTTDFTIPDQLEANRLYKFYVASGKRIQIDLAGPAGADFDLHLYAPGTTSILPRDVQPLVSANEKTATERIIYDVPASGYGTFCLEVLRFNGSGPATLQITSSATPAAPATTRIYGPDRYATAATISRTSYPAGSSAAVLCSGRSFPDGLAASSLAGALNAPILLSAPDALPDTVGREMQRLGVDQVYIVGGVSAVGFPVEGQITRYVPGVVIRRVSGATRYETAGEVADKVHEITGVRPERAFLACGESFPDALALSPVAFATETPILLVRKTSLPEATKAAITRLRGGAPDTLDLVVAGGEAAVSLTVAQEAAAAAGGTLKRSAGVNRYETALAIAEMAVFAGWADPASVAVASGVTFPDALGGAPLPGGRSGVLLLCPVTELGAYSTSYMQSFDFAVEQAWVLGGTAAVAAPVVTQIADILPDTAHNYTN